MVFEPVRQNPHAAGQAAHPESAPATKAQMMRVTNGPGRILLGPKQLHGCYARIVSLKDGSGSIERYEPRSRAWVPAYDSITFSEVWSAPSAPVLSDGVTLIPMRPGRSLRRNSDKVMQ
jgi:hypothetical protein